MVSISEEGRQAESSKQAEGARVARSSRAIWRILRIRFAATEPTRFCLAGDSHHLFVGYVEVRVDVLHIVEIV